MTASTDPYMDFLVDTAPEVSRATRDQLAALLAPDAPRPFGAAARRAETVERPVARRAAA